MVASGIAQMPSQEPPQLQHSTEFVEKQNSAVMRQTRMAKGDFHISRRPSHADFNIAYSEVKVRMPNQLNTPSNKGKIKLDVSFHDRFRRYRSPTNGICVFRGRE